MSKNIGEPIGIFLGVKSTTFEYLASIIAPYQLDYSPTMGNFIIIDNIEEYIVARIMDYVPQGEMTSYWGQKWLSEVALTPEVIGQDIKTRKISYSVKIKLLGRLSKDLKEFIPGIKKIPHLTSKVIKPNSEIVKIICNKALKEMEEGIEIGQYWTDESINIHFDMHSLVGKRTFIFARAGYGKSNLMKILASNWKEEFGSLIIFDPEGEYSITDKKGRPGIMDQIPALLITNRIGVRDYLDNNVYDKLKFDFRDFHPRFIVPIIVSESKYEFVFFNKLMSLNKIQWRDLVDYLYENRYNSEYEQIADKMGIRYEKPVDVTPILNNIIPPMDQLHDPDSKLFPIIEQAVERNSIIIIDISLLDSHNALNLSSMIISKFFRKNQREFTTGKEDLKRITFVVEEAQSVIGGSTNVSRFVELAKEGRKYQLGGIFITQQPGSISMDILSQGDNFFVFHLLSKDDLKALKKANAHFSNDILTQVLSEPIPGKSYMWTSHQPFVIPLKIKNFEDIVKPHKAKELQSTHDILMTILRDIIDLDQVEQGIINKFLDVISGNNLNLEDRKVIFEDEIKKQLTINTFNLLNKDEIKFLEQRNCLAKNKETHKPYALSYNYLGELYQKTLIFLSNKNDEHNRKSDNVNSNEELSLKPLESKQEVDIKSDPNKGMYVDDLIFIWETEKAAKFGREEDDVGLWIPKAAISGLWTTDKKPQKIFLKFIPDNFSWVLD
ncbi:MAG: ATP-binding protein [Promethearchaeota archaeon]|nr:MAG: ATP-binding protein [Candidatus Lokiarchaeota archaeon]